MNRHALAGGCDVARKRRENGGGRSLNRMESGASKCRTSQAVHFKEKRS